MNFINGSLFALVSSVSFANCVITGLNGNYSTSAGCKGVNISFGGGSGIVIGSSQPRPPAATSVPAQPQNSSLTMAPEGWGAQDEESAILELLAYLAAFHTSTGARSILPLSSLPVSGSAPLSPNPAMNWTGELSELEVRAVLALLNRLMR